MTVNHRERLRAIRDFPELVAYLHDELDWPVGDSDFEDLTFDYTPEELGIDEANAAKIRDIKRLRPLTAEQPWGIFFVSFEPKRLPVVALRRILGSVAVKKRASANAAERLAWKADDLLFVSNYGEHDSRHVSFAHFAIDEAKNDLPTLKVLGWDDRDTPLHLDGIADTLKQNLLWPDDPSDLDAWRTRWRSAFTLKNREVITTSRALAISLAELARRTRDRILTVLAIETPTGPVTRLMSAFKDALIHDLDQGSFADMYAQTIAYGLLSARVAHPSKNTADELASAMPATTPFLKELMETFLTTGGRQSSGVDFDELGVSEVVDLLDAANMEAVLRDFGDRNPDEDPVIHFYELFLKEYDSEKRMQRGVFYTPRPVVSYIVRSVHEILRQEFGLADGLADTSTWGEVASRGDIECVPAGISPTDPFVSILDPATGTGTFLVEAIGTIHQTLTKKWSAAGSGADEIADLWNDYVPRHLLTRLYGYELLMAPYAIAHLKIGLKLHETGYRFDSDERTRVYLTNSLEPPHDFSGRLEFAIPALAHEARAVSDVKKNHHFTVVIGNPPYAGVSANLEPAARAMVEPYRFVDGQRIREKGSLQFEKNLNDDYVKFVRFAESQVEDFLGVVGFVTNNGFLDSATLRGMRSHLLSVFERIQVVDLHGDADKRERDEHGGIDKNVFDIKRGVCISLLTRCGCRSQSTLSLSRFDIRGSAEKKYEWLTRHSEQSTPFEQFEPRPPKYLFIQTDEALEQEYLLGVAVPDLLGVNSTGFESGRDEVLTAFTVDELREQLTDFATAPIDQVKSRYSTDKGWGQFLLEHRGSIVSGGGFESEIKPFLFAPFDIRYCLYRKRLLKTNSDSAGKHLIRGKNVALMVMRQVSFDGPFTHIAATAVIPNNRCFYSTKGKVSYFPLWLYEEEEGLLALGDESAKRSNLRLEAVRSLCEQFTSVSAKLPSDEDVFDYALAVLNSPTFAERYKSYLSKDFPRVPRATTSELFDALALLGARLRSAYLLEGESQLGSAVLREGRADQPVDRPTWIDGCIYLTPPPLGRASNEARIVGVDETIWNTQIGGYQVCHKWLKDRKGRILSSDDLARFSKVVAALSEIAVLQNDVDATIWHFGGWPHAFVPQLGASALSHAAEAQNGSEPDEVGTPAPDGLVIEAGPSATLWADGTQLRGKF